MSLIYTFTYVRIYSGIREEPKTTSVTFSDDYKHQLLRTYRSAPNYSMDFVMFLSVFTAANICNNVTVMITKSANQDKKMQQQ